MSILYEDEHGWFICSKTYIDKNSEKCFDEDELQFKTLKLRCDFFSIKTPFLMKSAAIKRSGSFSSEIEKDRLVNPKKIRRRKKIALNLTPDEVVIRNRSDLLCRKARDLGYLELSPITSKEWFDNNSKAINAAKEVPCCSQENESFENTTENSVLKKIGNEKFMIPVLSKFYLCDINSLDNLRGQKFDLILMDPPWENKGIKRNKRYKMLPHTLLDSLPIGDLCLPGCLLVVWLTNNSTQTNHVKHVLFPKWNVQSTTVWHWTKVTQKGNYIHPFGWHHKKPYENLLLGYVGTEKGAKSMLDSHKVLVSVPSSVHSQKPPLVEILKPYLPENPRCLELFARYLLPGWTSLGNEVLKLQNVKLFEVLH